MRENKTGNTNQLFMAAIPSLYAKQPVTHLKFLYATPSPGLPAEAAESKGTSGRWHPRTSPSLGKLCHNPAPSQASLLPP